MKLHLFLLLLPTALLAQSLATRPALEANFLAKKGHFYQLEIAEGDNWKPLGAPIKGAGIEVKQAHPVAPDSKLRVTRLRKQWVPVWSDEFNGSEIDPTKWSHVEDGYGGGNKELQYYSTEPKYSYVRDGKLHMRAYRDSHTTVDNKTQQYTSSRLRTMHRGEWKYGKFEIRAKLPSGEGIWPAIWMLPTKSKYGSWAACGEIDIVESRGNETHQTLGTLHFGDFWPKNVHQGGSFDFPKKKSHEDYHVYGLVWKEDEISWFVDGHKWQTIKKEDWWTSAAKDNPSAPFDQEFHLIMNLAVGGYFFGNTKQDPKNLRDSEFPQTMLIDYVRISQWAE